MIYLTHENHANVLTALAQIDANMGFPANGTNSWGTVCRNVADTLSFVIKPPINGWKNSHVSFTQEQMMTGVVNVIEQEYDSSWLPNLQLSIGA